MTERDSGHRLYSLIKRLFPICRSITGDGVRETLAILKEYIPLEVHEVPTGTRVFDWTVPREWNIKDAFIVTPGGEKIAEFRQLNLHVLNYSIPVDTTVTLNELKNHVHTIPQQPDLVPYRTSYYRDDWGFCISHNRLQALDDGAYRVVVDAVLQDGSLTYGEYVLPGQTEEEVLISTHICHPSLANDNLSGMVIATFLARQLTGMNRRYTYRFLFIPGTIGAISWLSLNREKAERIRHGLVLAGLGDSGDLTYKKSRQDGAEIDRAVSVYLKHTYPDPDIRGFSPYGYDERQYCSPGFNLPVGRLSRTPYGEYSEYHSSADNLRFVHKDKLSESLTAVLQIVDILESNQRYRNLNPMCEPQLGKRGLYERIGSHQLAMLWVLNLSDGQHSLLDIAERSKIEYGSIKNAAEVLMKSMLVQ
jgi:aminopeptidase-like protein